MHIAELNDKTKKNIVTEGINVLLSSVTSIQIEKDDFEYQTYQVYLHDMRLLKLWNKNHAEILHISHYCILQYSTILNMMAKQMKNQEIVAQNMHQILGKKMSQKLK